MGSFTHAFQGDFLLLSRFIETLIFLQLFKTLL